LRPGRPPHPPGAGSDAPGAAEGVRPRPRFRTPSTAAAEHRRRATAALPSSDAVSPAETYSTRAAPPPWPQPDRGRGRSHLPLAMALRRPREACGRLRRRDRICPGAPAATRFALAHRRRSTAARTPPRGVEIRAVVGAPQGVSTVAPVTEGATDSM